MDSEGIKSAGDKAGAPGGVCGQDRTSEQKLGRGVEGATGEGAPPEAEANRGSFCDNGEAPVRDEIGAGTIFETRIAGGELLNNVKSSAEELGERLVIGGSGKMMEGAHVGRLERDECHKNYGDGEEERTNLATLTPSSEIAFADGAWYVGSGDLDELPTERVPIDVNGTDTTTSKGQGQSPSRGPALFAQAIGSGSTNETGCSQHGVAESEEESSGLSEAGGPYKGAFSGEAGGAEAVRLAVRLLIEIGEGSAADHGRALTTLRGLCLQDAVSFASQG